MTAASVSAMLRRLGLDVRPGEVLPATSLFFYFFLIGTVQFTGKTVRQSSFVDSLGSANLPFVYLIVALCALPLLRVYERFTDEVPRHRLMVATTLACSAILVLFWWLYRYPWSSVRFVYYIWFSLATVLLVSQFWSYASHLFDPRQARRLFGFVGAGGLLGAVAGGQLAATLAGFKETRLVLLVGALLLVAAAALALYIERRVGPKSSRALSIRGGVEPASAGFEAIRRSRHLQVIAALMAFSVMVAQIVDFQFNWAVEAATENLDQRTAAFGTVFSIMGFSAFFFQLLVTGRIHRTLGVGFAMRVLPVSAAIGSAVLLVGNPVLSLLLVVSSLRVTEAGLRYSLDQATREILFVPIPAIDRAKAKAFIDVAVQRFARGGAAILLLSVTFGWLTPIETSWMTIVLTVLWLGATVAARRQYVSSLRSGLDAARISGRFPTERLELLDPNDVTTLEVLVQSLGSADAGQVLHSVDLLAAHGRGRLVPPLLLYHDDAEVRHRTLQVLAQEGRRDALPLIERLIGDPDLDVRAEAIRALAVLSGTAGPHMMRERLDDADLRVRSAAIACLADQGDEVDAARAETALLSLLSDADPVARGEAAKALSEIDEPRFQELVVQLLYDADVQVVKEAIAAVRRRVSRSGNEPLYVPILISLLRDRRLKHDAREALVACGEEVIPALAHFMNDPNEMPWVRRGLPKTIARMATPSARAALVGSLGASDPFLRGKVIESLGAMGDVRGAAEEIERQLAEECRKYYVCFVDLLSLGSRRELRLVGPMVRWTAGYRPSLLEELLANRMGNHLRNVFGLLALVAPRQEIWGAYFRLLGDRAALRNHALEYLDNILTGSVRRPLLAVIDDVVLDERLRQAKRLFGLEPGRRERTLERIIGELPSGDADASWMVAAALHTVWADRVEPLYAAVRRATESEDPLIQETAMWVERELASARAPLAERRGR